MEDNEFDATLRKLSQQVENFNPVKKKSKGLNISLPNLQNSTICHIAAPVGIAVVLMFTRPKIVLKEKINDKGEQHMKLDFKRLLLTTILLSVVIFILYYFIRSKLANKSNTTEEF